MNEIFHYLHDKKQIVKDDGWVNMLSNDLVQARFPLDLRVKEGEKLLYHRKPSTLRANEVTG